MSRLVLVNARVPELFLDGGGAGLDGQPMDCVVEDGRYASVHHGSASIEERSIDLRGRWLLPAFCDSHVHFVYGAARERMRADESLLLRCLEGDEIDVEDFDRWLLGISEYGGKQFSRLDDLPCFSFVWSPDHHRAHVNRRAADWLGVAPGVLVEGEAFAAWERLPQSGGDLVTEAERWLECGVGAVTTFDRLGSLEQLVTWAEAGDLPLRVGHSLPVEELLAGSDRLPTRIDPRSWDRRHFQVRWVKMFFDGTLGSSTASLFEPYCDGSGDRGLNLIDGETRSRACDMIAGSGFSVAIHAIGDRAVDEAARFIGELREKRGSIALDRIEHAELIDPATIERLSQQQIPVSVQPCHLLEDWRWAHERWGRERTRRMFPLRTLAEKSVPMVFGTDAPVEIKDPWVNLRAAVDRRGRGATEAFVPEESISLEQALAAYTFDAAELNDLPSGWGRIAAGSPADFQILDTDAPLEDICELSLARWSATVVDGELVAGAWPAPEGVA